MKKIPQILIAAPTSGSGKTTVARGLMALFSEKGMKVQPYKCGPDYIDTKFHTKVCGRPSVNLDTFMATEPHVRRLYAHYAKDADACIVEGMMGMYDGYERYHGSSYDIARLLGIPIVLVVDARSAAYSMAALLSGFIGFRDDMSVCGVIFNKVGSARHFDMLRQVCDDLNIECLGYLPKNTALDQGSRYLGLDFSQQTEFRQLVNLIEEYVDWQRLIQLTTKEIACFESKSLNHPAQHETSVPNHSYHHLYSWIEGNPSCGIANIAVAQNSESFSFLYQEHLDILQLMGHVTFFDPEKDEVLPSNTDLLYLPGGYPEKHLQALAKAEHTRESIRAFACRGGRILAECGGMMYLCKSILCDEGEFTMCGVLPYSISARKEHRRLSLGYRKAEWGGLQLRGHEFHYTQFHGQLPPSAVQVLNAKGGNVSTPIIHHGNVIASYTHLYWGETNILRLFEDSELK